MLRLFFLAAVAVVIVAVGYVVIPRNTSRPETHFATPAASQPDPNAFVVHEAAPPTSPLPPVSAAPQTTSGTSAGQAPTTTAASNPGDLAATSNLDLLMQRLRANSDPSTPPAPAPGPVTPPGPVSPPGQQVLTPPVIAPAPQPASRWTNVTAQGTRWHMTPGTAGYTIAIDLGGGRIAEVRVLPAFASLDSAGVNQRVDYLKQTILQNFPPESASYTFARDGSVSLNN